MTTFLKSTALAALLAFPLAASAAETPVSEISVNADLTAIENVTAASVWKNLPADLERELAMRLADQISEDGAEVMIDINMVELATAFEEAANLADSTLSGDVIIERPGADYDQAYSLTVNAEQATVLLPEGTDIALLAPGSAEFYNAMISAFAANVVEKMQ